jgi:cytochrome c oxidase cbb3-type subunit I/II
MHSSTNNHLAAKSTEIESVLVRAHSLAAFVNLMLAVVFGILVSLQFVAPDLFGGLLPSWGRLRYVHTQGIMLGWLGNAFLAFLYYAVPILSDRPVFSRNLGLILFSLWNLAVMLPGITLVLMGVSQPLEWAEFPLVVDFVVMVTFVLAATQFLPPFFSRSFDNLYVSSWYIIGALVFTLLSYPMGNFVPELVPGAAGAAFSGLWIHDAVGLFVTPLALAVLYFVVPATTGKPIYSHFLSMIGFWGLFFIYPLNGIHHYIYSAIPMAAQTAAILASFLLAVIVIIVVSNLMLSMRGCGFFPKEISLRFASTGIVFYLLVSLQGSLQANMSLNQLTHFTDWVIGHSHLAMLGFATFAGIAGIVHAWQRLPDAVYNLKFLNWSYWLLTIGITLMVVDLALAGLVQGRLWQEGAPWIESIRAAGPYWLIRSLCAVPISLGFIFLIAGLVTGIDRYAINSAATSLSGEGSDILSEDLDEASDRNSFSPVSRPLQALQMSYLVASVAGVGFFVLSVTLLGVLPFQALENQSAALAPAQALLLSPSEVRGKVIYASEGCAYCHTQQIRYTDADMKRFGAPSLAWEGRMDYPHMLGTRRIGPDLARAAYTRPAQWHLAHLFAPRSVVPESIMPSYPEFFKGSPLKPKQKALDLVAYLETLGRERELAWPEGDTLAVAKTEDVMALMSLNAPELNAHPHRTRPFEGTPELPEASNPVLASELWALNCSGCHGSQGKGDGPAAAWLVPKPINLSQHEYSSDLIADILWNGVHGSSMPAWRDLSPSQLAELAAQVSRFSEVETAIANSQILHSGQAVFMTHCAECHGDEGDGNGFAADSLPIPIRPSDFTRERLTHAESLRVLRSGVAGSAMAPWGDRLTSADMEAVSHYLRSLYKSPAGESADD